MRTVSLIFDQANAYLGEVATHDGALDRVMLTPTGEQNLGAYLAEWQTRGVPTMREVAKHEKTGVVYAFYLDRVQVREKEFLPSVRRWLEGRSWALVTLDLSAVDCWETILRLPLEPRERFVMVVALRAVPQSGLLAWKQALNEAAREAEAEDRATAQAVKKLWERTAKELVSKFASQ